MEGRFDLTTLLPGVVDLLLQPRKYLFSLCLVVESIDEYLPRVEGDEFAMNAERERGGDATKSPPPIAVLR
jgi:hypothetical protein